MCSPRAVAEMTEAIALSGEEFQKKYGYARPGEADPLIIHCNKGGRAAKAVALLVESGYTNTKSVSLGYRTLSVSLLPGL